MQLQKTPQALTSLTELCQRLDSVLSADPMAQMEHQIKQQQLDTEQNCRWLDQAMALLSQLSTVDNPEMAEEIIEKVESFVSKDPSDDYYQNKCIVDMKVDRH